MAQKGAAEVIPRTPKQVQRRLKPDEVSELVSAYRAGEKVSELAARFGIHLDACVRLQS